MAWAIRVHVGDHYQTTVFQDVGSEVPADTPTILDDLEFGWSFPGTMWPAQPEAMFASFSIQVPTFADYAAFAEGDLVYITLSATTGIDDDADPDENVIPGPIVAAFFGRVTDLKATPLGDDPGVSIDVTAIDYTADLLEAPETILDGGITREFQLVQRAFHAATGYYLPGTGGNAPVPDQWTSPLFDHYVPYLDTVQPGKVIDDMLRQAVNPGTGTRMIVQPVVDYDGLVTSRLPFTLVTLSRYGRPGVQVELDADDLDLDITWTQVKGDNPASVTVTYGGDGIAPVTAALPGVAGTDLPLKIEVEQTPDADEAGFAAAVANFYLRAPAGDELAWWPSSLTWRLDEVSPGDQAANLALLFPDLAANEADNASRSRCYGVGAVVSHLDPSVVPFVPSDPSNVQLRAALVSGVTVRLVDGVVSVELSTRYPSPA